MSFQTNIQESQPDKAKNIAGRKEDLTFFLTLYLRFEIFPPKLKISLDF